MSAPSPPRSPPWKGKAREIDVRDEGAGGQDGIVIPIQLLQDSAYQAVYVVPAYLGSDLSKHLLQIDTGSSDLWIASTSCATAPCNSVGGARYDPSQSIPSGQLATVVYAEGQVDGPVVWDSVQLGGYSIDHQALLAASTVNDEPLSSNFAGVLGLALPLNSVIAQKIPPTTSDAPDGAAISANLFGITPTSTAPTARFFSLALERPGSSKVPSTLGIGRHPSDLVPDPSKIQYSSVVAQPTGSLYWQADISAITVYTNGQPRRVNIPLVSVATHGPPSAILDSGIPLIIASPEITYGIYGAMDIGPASDGNFYLPCNQPLNLTVTLDSRQEIWLHPLDLTYFPPDDPSAEMCIGAIQTADHIGLTLTQADMILGVPFLRNTYTVMAYDPPLPNGSFPTNAGSASRIQPRLGLLQLTDPATAADEFHQVRVLKQPLGSSGGGGGAAQGTSKKGLSVGIEVLIGLLGFFGLCFVLFGARLAYMKRRWIRDRRRGGFLGRGGAGGESGAQSADSKEGSYVLNELGYHPAPRKSGSESDPDLPSEDELRQARFEAYKRRRDLDSQYTDDTSITRVDQDADADEFGTVLSGAKGKDSPEDRFRDPWADTLVDGRPASYPRGGANDGLAYPPPTALRASAARRASYASSPLAHHRTLSGGPGAGTPLLAHGRTHSGSDGDQDIAEFGRAPGGDDDGRRTSMAGVGTSGRSRRLGSGGSGSGLGLGLPEPLLSPTFGPMVPPPEVDERGLGGEGAGAGGATPPFVPSVDASPRALDPVYSASRNESRVSVIGHEAL
ncbi:aspartic peptidase domain-containing protein [Trametes elegans]|nr:aspartic peptidase domain-containing protein [Trametes elegans]